jgi:hypothetical protein
VAVAVAVGVAAVRGWAAEPESNAERERGQRVGAVWLDTVRPDQLRGQVEENLCQ